MTKLAIVEEREEDKYEFLTALRDWQTGTLSPDPAPKQLVDGVLSSMSSARQSEVKAWEEEIVTSQRAGLDIMIIDIRRRRCRKR